MLGFGGISEAPISSVPWTTPPSAPGGFVPAWAVTRQVLGAEMSFKRNVAVTGFTVGMVNKTDGSAITSGTVNGFATKDGGSQTALTNALTHEGNGQWSVDLTAGEMDASVVGLVFTHASGIPQQITIKTVLVNPDDATAFGVSRIDAAITSRLAPTVAARTLDVSAGGEAGVDWANVGSPTTVLGLSGTTVKTATDVETDTANIQTRIPAALVSGRMDSSVGAMAADTVNASALAADAVAEIQSGLGTSANQTAIINAVEVVDDLLDTEIAAIVATLSTISGFVDTEVAAILARIGAFTGTGNNTILGFFQAIARKTAALTPSDMGGNFDNTTDSLEAIRDRGDSAWITGSGGSGGGFDGPNAVTIRFRDADSNPIANVTFIVEGVGSGTTDGTGEITVSLPDGDYDIRAIPTSGVFWSPASFTVSGTDTFNFDGVTVASAGNEERSAAYLVSLTRDIMGERGSHSIYRDGFDTDTDYDESISILVALNTRQREASETGYYKCFFSFNMTALNGSERNDRYAKDTRSGRIRELVITDESGDYYPLKETSIGDLNTNHTRYRNQVSGRPTEYYVDGDIIGFNKAPDYAYTVTYLAETVAPDMVNPTDTPHKLPVRFHEMLAYGAAIDLLSHKLHKEGVIHIVNSARAKWDMWYTDLQRVSRTAVINSKQAVTPSARRMR